MQVQTLIFVFSTFLFDFAVICSCKYCCSFFEIHLSVDGSLLTVTIHTTDHKRAIAPFANITDRKIHLKINHQKAYL